jgi:hypothetical protein
MEVALDSSYDEPIYPSTSSRLRVRQVHVPDQLLTYHSLILLIYKPLVPWPLFFFPQHTLRHTNHIQNHQAKPLAIPIYKPQQYQAEPTNFNPNPILQCTQAAAQTTPTTTLFKTRTTATVSTPTACTRTLPASCVATHVTTRFTALQRVRDAGAILIGGGMVDSSRMVGAGQIGWGGIKSR